MATALRVALFAIIVLFIQSSHADSKPDQTLNDNDSLKIPQDGQDGDDEHIEDDFEINDDGNEDVGKNLKNDNLAEGYDENDPNIPDDGTDDGENDLQQSNTEEPNNIDEGDVNDSDSLEDGTVKDICITSDIIYIEQELNIGEIPNDSENKDVKDCEDSNDEMNMNDCATDDKEKQEEANTTEAPNDSNKQDAKNSHSLENESYMNYCSTDHEENNCEEANPHKKYYYDTVETRNTLHDEIDFTEIVEIESSELNRDPRNIEVYVPQQISGNCYNYQKVYPYNPGYYSVPIPYLYLPIPTCPLPVNQPVINLPVVNLPVVDMPLIGLPVIDLPAIQLPETVMPVAQDRVRFCEQVKARGKVQISRRFTNCRLDLNRLNRLLPTKLAVL